MEYLMFLGIIVAIVLTFWLLEQVLKRRMRNNKINGLINDELVKLEEKHFKKYWDYLKLGYSHSYKIVWDTIRMKFWAKRGKNAWEIIRRVTKDI